MAIFPPLKQAGLLFILIYTPHDLYDSHIRNNNIDKMKFLAILALCASLASAGVVITPIFDNQVVAKESGDCALGVVTPSGCG